jgi:hypothetical protein
MPRAMHKAEFTEGSISESRSCYNYDLQLLDMYNLMQVFTDKRVHVVPQSCNLTYRKPASGSATSKQEPPRHRGFLPKCWKSISLISFLL